MKRWIYLLIMGLNCSLAQAQFVHFGLKGGINYANITHINRQEAYQNNVGFHAGLTGNITLDTRALSLQPEILYSQKGYNYRSVSPMENRIEYTDRGSVNFSYLDMPVLLKANRGGFFVEAGPQASYLLDVQDNTNMQINDLGQREAMVVDKSQLQNWEIGYAAGIGLETFSGITLGLRYNGNFQNLAPRNASIANARHKVVQLHLGVLLGQ